MSKKLTLKVVDWGDDAYKRTKEATGEATSEVLATVQIPEFKGLSFDGGRLEIVGHPDTIWVSSHQWSIDIN